LAYLLEETTLHQKLSIFLILSFSALWVGCGKNTSTFDRKSSVEFVYSLQLSGTPDDIATSVIPTIKKRLSVFESSEMFAIESTSIEQRDGAEGPWVDVRVRVGLPEVCIVSRLGPLRASLAQILTSIGPLKLHLGRPDKMQIIADILKKHPDVKGVGPEPRAPGVLRVLTSASENQLMPFFFEQLETASAKLDGALPRPTPQTALPGVSPSTASFVYYAVTDTEPLLTGEDIATFDVKLAKQDPDVPSRKNEVAITFKPEAQARLKTLIDSGQPSQLYLVVDGWEPQYFWSLSPTSSDHSIRYTAPILGGEQTSASQEALRAIALGGPYKAGVLDMKHEATCDP